MQQQDYFIRTKSCYEKTDNDLKTDIDWQDAYMPYQCVDMALRYQEMLNPYAPDDVSVWDVISARNICLDEDYLDWLKATGEDDNSLSAMKYAGMFSDKELFEKLKENHFNEHIEIYYVPFNEMTRLPIKDKKMVLSDDSRAALKELIETYTGKNSVYIPDYTLKANEVYDEENDIALIENELVCEAMEYFANDSTNFKHSYKYYNKRYKNKVNLAIGFVPVAIRTQFNSVYILKEYHQMLESENYTDAIRLNFTDIFVLAEDVISEIKAEYPDTPSLSTDKLNNVEKLLTKDLRLFSSDLNFTIMFDMGFFDAIDCMEFYENFVNEIIKSGGNVSTV